MPIVSTGQITITDVNDSPSAVLSNESAVVPANPDGSSPVLTGCITTLSVNLGGVDDSLNWTVAATPSSGVTGTLATRTYTVTGFTVDAGWVDLTATRVGWPSLTKRFNLSKSKQGVTGATGAAGSNGLNFSEAKLLFSDPTFQVGSNGVSVYNNSGGGTVTHARIAKLADSPFTDSGFNIEVSNTGVASPGIGGFVQLFNARASAVFVQRIVAKLPVGYSLEQATNAMGDGATNTWITSKTGTGKFEEYILVRRCGATGSFSSSGHIYAIGTAGTPSVPVKWWLAYAATYDFTALGFSTVVGLLSNDSHTVPTDSAGNNGNFTGAATTLTIFNGTADDSANWAVTAAATNVTGSLAGRTYTVTAMSADTGFVDLTATRGGFSNVVKRFTLSKSKGGVTGATGATGAQGPQGVQGPAVVVTPDRATTFTSTDGTLDGSQADIVFTAAVSGVTSPTYAWTFSGLQTNPTASTTATQTVTAAQFGTSKAAIVTCTVSGAYTDKVTIVRLERSTAAAGANQTSIDANGNIQGVSSGAGTTVNNAVAIGDMLNSGGGLLPNWNLRLVDAAGKPAGIQAVEGITDRSGVAFGDASCTWVKIHHATDTTVAYGFPAIPIDDRRVYVFRVRHKSTSASPPATGLYYYFIEKAGALATGKTHAIRSTGDATVGDLDTTVKYVYSNSAYPNNSGWAETADLVYVPTIGTRFASFAAANWGFATTVELHIDAVYLTSLSSTVYRQAAQPSGGIYVKGDIWVDTDATGTPAYQYDGAAWQVMSNYTTNTNQLTDGANLGGTAAWAGVSNRPIDGMLLNNLSDASAWIPGATPPGTLNGTLAENRIIWGVGPKGLSTNLWETVSAGTNNANGGWNTGAWSTLAVDKTKTYRFIVPICVTNTGATGTAFWGIQGNTVCNLNTSTLNNNPYFATLARSLAVVGRWYIFVGFVFPQGSVEANNDSAGVYDATTGAKVAGGTNFCWSSTTTTSSTRGYLYYSTSTADRQLFAPPLVHMVNGVEPSLNDLFSSSAILNSNVRIGGTNLIKNSTLATFASVLFGSPTISTESIALPDGTTGPALKVVFGGAGGIRIPNCIRGNDTYSFSTWHRVLSGTASVGTDVNDGNGGNFVSGTSWAWHKQEGLTVTTYTPTVFHFMDLGVSAATTLYLWRPKVEFGNKATDWSPAPEDVSASINVALNQLSDIASDAVLAPAEKREVRKHWDIAINEKAGLNTEAGRYAAAAAVNTAYNTAIQALGTYLNGGTAYTLSTSVPPVWINDAGLGTSTAIVGATFRTNWQAHFVARQVLVNKITEEAGKVASWVGVSGAGKPQDNATNNVVGSGTLAARPTGTDGDFWYATDTGAMYQKVSGAWVLSSTNTSIDASGNIQGVSGGAGQSVANNVDNVIRAPVGGVLTSTTASVTGALKIKLPQLWSSTMMKFTVEIFEYLAGFSCTLEIAGYNTPNRWINCTARVIGGSNVEYPVRFGRDADKCCVWIGNSNETWAYPQVRVRDVFLGYSNASAAQWSTGWVVSFDTTTLTSGAEPLAANQFNVHITDTLPGADWAKTSGANKPADGATRNVTTYASTAPSSPANGDIWVDTSVTPNVTRLRVAGAWQVAANNATNTNQLTDGANLGGTATWGGVTGTGKPADGATRNIVTRSATAPTVPTPVDGDMWVDTSGSSEVIKIRAAGVWQVAATVGADSSNLLAGTSGNLLYNAGFEDGVAGWVGNLGTTGLTVVGGHISSTEYTSYGTLGGAGLAYAVPVGGTPTSGSTFSLRNADTHKVPVVAGKRYEYHGLLNVRNCTGSMRLEFLSSSGVVVGTFNAGSVTLANTINSYADMVQAGGFAVAPANSVHARLNFLGASNGTANPHVFCKNAFFGEAGAAQTELSPYSPGRAVSQVTLGVSRDSFTPGALTAQYVSTHVTTNASGNFSVFVGRILPGALITIAITSRIAMRTDVTPWVSFGFAFNSPAAIYFEGSVNLDKVIRFPASNVLTNGKTHDGNWAGDAGSVDNTVSLVSRVPHTGYSSTYTVTNPDYSGDNYLHVNFDSAGRPAGTNIRFDVVISVSMR